MKAFLAVLIFAIAIAIALPALQRPSFNPDGVVYARMMLADRGVPAAQAREQVRAFYLTTPLGHNARYRPFLLNENLGMFTMTAKPFGSRVVYPLVAAGLFPWRHFQALPLVSAIAYVVATVLVYWLLLAFCAPAAAAVGALLFAVTPVMRDLNNAALTDMLALCLLVAVTGAMIRYALNGGNGYLALTAVCAIALSLTRPLPYVPLGAALGLGVYAFAIRRDRAQLRKAALLAIVALVAWGAYALAALLTHTPSLSSHLHWLYNAAKTHWIYESNRPLSYAEQHSFSAWYGHQLVYVVKGWIKTLFVQAYPVIALIACACGLYLRRRNPQSWIFAGGILACCLGIFANPIEPELRRLVEAPATIGVIGGIAMLLQVVPVPKVFLAKKHA